MSDIIVPGPATVFGTVRGYHVVPQGGGLPDEWVRPAKLKDNKNLVLYEWATIMANLLSGSQDGKPYSIGAVYLEFENNSGAPVSAPTPTRDDGKTYYNALSGDPVRDYLRVPVTAMTKSSTDETNFPNGNKVTVFAQSTGVTGVHGKSFSDTVSSRIYGGALVATPEFADQTQDLVFSRFYFDTTAKQLIKQASSQVGLQWDITYM